MFFLEKNMIPRKEMKVRSTPIDFHKNFMIFYQ